MSRILVVGGYGGFGGRLSRRLTHAGHEVLVAGRSPGKAAAFCKGNPGCRPVRLDRNGDVAGVIAGERPDMMIDAAGPFQESGYQVAEACIAAGIHYLDLADAREFVTKIARLDAAAKGAGVAVIAGASSVPALSQAVIDRLAAGLDHLTAIEVTISASSRASAGDSVARAILGGAGQPLRLWQGKRWTQRFGGQSLRVERLALPSGRSIGGRLVALADVPDLALLPGRYSGRPAVGFRAGTESSVANLALWAGSWLVRGGLIRSLAPARRLLVPLHRLTGLWGSDRSGMLVRVFGMAQDRRVERRWTLIAERGDGPEIPTLAAAILADRIKAGGIAAGARDAGGLLSLAEFEDAFRGLRVEHATMEIAQAEPLYARVMGGEFDRLKPAVRRVHQVLRDNGATGRASVERGGHPIARLVAWIMRFPPAGEYPLHVHFTERGGVERWTRDFGGHRFSSRLWADDKHRLVECFGPLRFRFRLPVENGALRMDLERWSLGPLPLPKLLAPRSPAREWEEDGRFHFEVPIALPLIGLVVHYRGWLQS